VFVLTADQAGSRKKADLVKPTLKAIRDAVGHDLLRPPTRTVGDELQAVTDKADCALEVILLLDQSGEWSVGCGVGRVDLPVPSDTRAASGPAFVAAREAVEAAKRSSPRFALRFDEQSVLSSADVEPLIDLLLAVRARRTDEGWELYKLLRAGASQVEAAQLLRISPQAASQRARAAQIRLETDAKPALVRLLEQADVPSSRRGA
jgi:hypothetical protein